MLEARKTILIATPAPLYREGIKIAFKEERNKTEHRIYEADSASDAQ